MMAPATALPLVSLTSPLTVPAVTFREHASRALRQVKVTADGLFMAQASALMIILEAIV
jgi:hypothetical protein